MFILNPVAIPVRLVVEISPSGHKAVQPKPGSPAPKLGVKPSCQTNPHSFHLLANQIVNIWNVPASNSPYISNLAQHFITLSHYLARVFCNQPRARPRGGHRLAENCSVAKTRHLVSRRQILGTRAILLQFVVSNFSEDTQKSQHIEYILIFHLHFKIRIV